MLFFQLLSESAIKMCGKDFPVMRKTFFASDEKLFSLLFRYVALKASSMMNRQKEKCFKVKICCEKLFCFK